MVDYDFQFEDFKASAADFMKKGFPEAAALGMRDTAQGARDAVRERTRGIFDLHTDYIPRGILSTPEKQGQLNRTANGFAKYGDMEGAVFLRPGTGKRALDFMLPHEVGGNKESDGSVAIPAQDIQNYKYRTSSGKTSARWKPARLLADFNANGGNVTGQRRGKNNSGNPTAPFVKKSRSSGTLQVVRRRTKKAKTLEVLYTFKRKAKIKPVWGFEQTVRTNVSRNYTRHFSKHLNRAIR